MFSGWLAGTAPDPNKVQVTGHDAVSANLITSLDAPDNKIPCPARITGFLELLIKSAALFSCFFSGIFI